MPDCFLSVPRLLTGEGAFGLLGREAAAFGTRAFLVTGRNAARASGLLDRAVALLEAAGCSVTVFDRVPPEPPITVVDEGRACARACAADFVVGLGGGSAMDVAKAVAALYHAPHPTEHYHDGGAWTHPEGLPFLGVPTTFGTASETTMAGVYTNPATHAKKSFKHPTMLARVAMVDPEAGLAAPMEVKAASGMDALTQAIEGYCSRGATPLTDALAFDAAERLLRRLPAFAAPVPDRAAAADVALASTMAGMAFTNAGLGLVHAVAHPVGAHTGWGHGLVCGLFLHHALRFNRLAIAEKYARLSAVAGGDIADCCERMLERLGIVTSLYDAGIGEGDLPALVEATLPSGSLKANPRICSADEVATFYRQTCIDGSRGAARCV